MTRTATPHFIAQAYDVDGLTLIEHIKANGTSCQPDGKAASMIVNGELVGNMRVRTNPPEARSVL